MQSPQNMDEMVRSWLSTMVRETVLNMAGPGSNVPSDYMFVPQMPQNAEPASLSSAFPSEVSSISVSPVAGYTNAAEIPQMRQTDDGRHGYLHHEDTDEKSSFNYGAEPIGRGETTGKANEKAIDEGKAPAEPKASRPPSPNLVSSTPHKPPSGYGETGVEISSSSPEVPVLDPAGKKHECYYFEDDRVTFRVEGVLFRVHRFFFERDSAWFRERILDNKQPHDGVIELSQCTGVIDFERFLSILYPASFNEHTAKTLDEWTSILALSTQWGFDTIRLLAIRELFPLATAVDKIVLAHKYDVKEWLLDAYKEVCLRKDSLSVEEAKRIGAEDTARVAIVREKLYRMDVRTQEVEETLIKAEFGLCDETVDSDGDGDSESEITDRQPEEVKSDNTQHHGVVTPPMLSPPMKSWFSFSRSIATPVPLDIESPVQTGIRSTHWTVFKDPPPSPPIICSPRSITSRVPEAYPSPMILDDCRSCPVPPAVVVGFDGVEHQGQILVPHSPSPSPSPPPIYKGKGKRGKKVKK